MKNKKFTIKEILVLLPLVILAAFAPKLFAYLNVPPEIIIVPFLVILMFFHIKTLPSDTTKEFKTSKIIALFGFLILAVVVLINYYLVHFFEFSIYLIVISLLPAFFYSVIYERKKKT